MTCFRHYCFVQWFSQHSHKFLFITPNEYILLLKIIEITTVSVFAFFFKILPPTQSKLNLKLVLLWRSYPRRELALPILQCWGGSISSDPIVSTRLYLRRRHLSPLKTITYPHHRHSFPPKAPISSRGTHFRRRHLFPPEALVSTEGTYFRRRNLSFLKALIAVESTHLRRSSYLCKRVLSPLAFPITVNTSYLCRHCLSPHIAMRLLQQFQSNLHNFD